MAARMVDNQERHVIGHSDVLTMPSDFLTAQEMINTRSVSAKRLIVRFSHFLLSDFCVW
jgi:hypothetical protein